MGLLCMGVEFGISGTRGEEWFAVLGLERNPLL